MPFFRPTRKRKDPDAPSRYGRHTITGIRKSVLQSLLAAGAGSYPNEFGGVLRSEEPGIVTDLLLVPGTTAGRRHANFQFYMLPADLTVVGTVHSHPSGALHPSGADITLFRHWGRFHIIVGSPFKDRCWRSYDNLGEPIPCGIVG